MPVDWLEKHVGENLRSDLMELQAKMQKMLEGWEMGLSHAGTAEKVELLLGEEEGRGDNSMATELREEFCNLRRKLVEAEDVILQQDKVVFHRGSKARHHGRAWPVDGDVSHVPRW